MRRQYVEQRIVTHPLSTGRLSDCGTKELVCWEGGADSDVPGGRYAASSFVQRFRFHLQNFDNKIPIIN